MDETQTSQSAKSRQRKRVDFAMDIVSLRRGWDAGNRQRVIEFVDAC